MAKSGSAALHLLFDQWIILMADCSGTIRKGGDSERVEGLGLQALLESAWKEDLSPNVLKTWTKPSSQTAPYA
jgi:hypothetical protein